MKSKTTLNVGIAQTAPVPLNLEKSLKKLLDWIDDGGTQNLDLLVFGETWLSGYPAWLDYSPGVARWDDPKMKEIYWQMHQSSIVIPGMETKLIGERANKYKMSICVGVNEKILGGPGNGTIYNSLLIFNEKGDLVVHHRKLMPTFSEKLVYGLGDGKDLNAVKTNAGRIGGLICWEHWMPLARQAMHNSGEDVHIALWPNVQERQQLASRHYAFEGRCFVIAAGQLLDASQLPEELKVPEEFNKLLRGGSCIINPRGEIIVEPVFDKEVLIKANIDLKMNIEERMTLDTSGHYQRNDVFGFEVNRERKN